MREDMREETTMTRPADVTGAAEPERALREATIAAAEELLDALSPTDLLYATALAPRSGAAACREAA